MASAGGPGGAALRVISWNVQAFGGRVQPRRREAYRALLEHIFADKRSAQVLAVQELASEKGAETFETLLPGGRQGWTRSFTDSNDSQDNGFYVQPGVQILCERPLFADRGKSSHPARMAHMRAGELDFTIVTVHLAYKGRSSAAAVRELQHILNWLQAYVQRPGTDPDIILAGDFNLPTLKGKEASRRARERGWPAIEEILSDYAPFRRDGDARGARIPRRTELVALVDDRTSRSKGRPANNYDHFLITGDLFDEEYVEGSAGVVPVGTLHAVEREKGTFLSDHYPISIGLRSRGPGKDGRSIHLDGNAACAP